MKDIVIKQSCRNVKFTNVTSVKSVCSNIKTLMNLPEFLLGHILSFLQTEKLIKNTKSISQHKLNQLILHAKKHINVDTDFTSLVNLSATCTFFKYFIRESYTGKLILNAYFDSLKGPISEMILEHSSLCTNEKCNNVCHYVKKDIKYTNVFKKIAKYTFNEKKNKCHKIDLVTIFGCYLTKKEIESYYKDKKRTIK